MVDYAIARKIVSLHNNVDDDTVERVYSQEEVLRYISFARQFKPIISEVSDLTQQRLCLSTACVSVVSMRSKAGMVNAVMCYRKLQIYW